MTTELVEPAHANAVSNFELGHFRDRGPNLDNGSNTFVAQTLIRVTEVLIGATDTAVSDLDANLGRAQVTMTSSLNQLSVSGALEISEVDTHACEKVFFFRLGSPRF